MSNNLILLSVIQAICLSAGQVLLKIAMQAQPAFSWTWDYFSRTLTNWWLLACGLTFTGAGLLWMYILRHYPFSQAYPLSSLAYVFGINSIPQVLYIPVEGNPMLLKGLYPKENIEKIIEEFLLKSEK